MDLSEAVRVVRGRWYVIVPLLVLTLVATLGVDRAVPTKYQVTSTFSLLASDQTVQGTAAVPGTDNAFMSFDGSLNDMADFLTRRVDAPDSAQQLLQQGVTEAYSADLAANAEGPFITLTVTGTSRTHVTTSIDTLLKFSQQELTEIQSQASVSPTAMIGSIVIVPPGPPTKQNKSKYQGVIGVAVVGLVIAFLATFATDSLVAARSRRRRGPRRTRPGQPGQPEPSGQPQPGQTAASSAASRQPWAQAETGPSEPAERSAPPDRTEVLSGLPETRD
jgi:hypothetical protein